MVSSRVTEQSVLLQIPLQWKLSITSSLGPGSCVCYVRYFVISTGGKIQYKTEQLISLGRDKIVLYYIRYFVISDLLHRVSTICPTLSVSSWHNIFCLV